MWEPSASSQAPTNDEDDRRRAALGYVVWPLALVAMIGDRDAAIWSRLHARQAVVLGVVLTVAYIAVLALPLLCVIAFPGISTGTTVILYGIALVVDLVLALALLVVAARYYGRALRGELFSVPLVATIVDRCFRLQLK